MRNSAGEHQAHELASAGSGRTGHTSTAPRHCLRADVGRRTTEFIQRIESFSTDTIDRRLARCLIRLSERMVAPQDDGSVRMPHFTHERLSEDVGTSREIVSHHMNQFRRQGYLEYSRKGTVLYRDALHRWCIRT